MSECRLFAVAHSGRLTLRDHDLSCTLVGFNVMLFIFSALTLASSVLCNLKETVADKRGKLVSLLQFTI